MTVGSKHPGTKPSVVQREDPPRYDKAVAALQEINLLMHGRSRGHKYLGELIDEICARKHRSVLYLGAGCSKAVRVDNNDLRPGSIPYEPRNWEELIKRLWEKLAESDQQDLLASIRDPSFKRRSESDQLTVDQLFSRFDKPMLAELISGYFQPEGERDRTIHREVEPPEYAARESELFDELLKLPFDDIVTTNYDSNVEYFLGKIGKKCKPITNPFARCDTLLTKDAVRLFYLHGKAGESPLVFDRRDFSKLAATPDGILRYVTFLLGDSNVVYVGFALNDPSFNLIEARVHQTHGPFRAKSFAFLPGVSKAESDDWVTRHLKIVDYGVHPNLPKILKCVNTIRQFIEWADPNWVPDAGLTEIFFRKGLQQYVEGKFVESLLTFRSALASTLFWKRLFTNAQGVSRLRDSQQSKELCQIRIRLALDHYKLQLSSDRENHTAGMWTNIKAGETIIQDARAHTSTQIPGLQGLENSLKILRARIAYHEGKYGEASLMCKEIISAMPSTDPLLGTMHDKEEILGRLEEGVCYFYARCLESRINYQLRSADSQIGLAGRLEEASRLNELAEKIREWREEINTFEGACQQLPEWHYYRNSMAAVHRIVVWTAGRHFVGFCEDVIPKQSERTEQNCKRLSKGIQLLSEDPGRSQGDEWGLSPRWSAMRCRYLCRGLALRWLINRHLRIREGDGDLLLAQATIREALQETVKAGMERQQVLNLLEAARLSIIQMFGESLITKSANDNTRPSACGFGLCGDYLNAAFHMMDALRATVHHGWLTIQGFRLASYYRIVCGPFLSSESAKFTHEDLRNFLQGEATEMMRKVTSCYREFGKNSFDDAHAFDRRIGFYEETMVQISSELAKICERAVPIALDRLGPEEALGN